MKIELYSGQCGSGKTYKLINKAIHLQKLGESVLIVQPSTALCDSTQAAIPNSVAIHGKNVSKRLSETLPQTNKVIIITHSEFVLFNFENSSYHLLFDEELSPMTDISIDLRNTTSLLNLQQQYHYADTGLSDYKKVTAADTKMLQDIVDNADDVQNIFNKLNKHVLSESSDVYTSGSMEDKLVNPDGYLKAIFLMTRSKFENWRSVSMYGARLEESLLVRVLMLDYVIMQPFVKHDGSHLTIHCANNKGWSMSANHKQVAAKQEFVKYTKKDMVGEFLLLDHESERSTYFDNKGIHLKHNVHGMNEYDDVLNVVCMSAINPDSTRRKFLTDVCVMDDAMIKRHYMTNLYYQVLMRSALRKKGNTQHVNFYCMDGAVAKDLVDNYFIGAKCVSVGSTVTSKRTVMTDEQKRINKQIVTKCGYMKKQHPELADMSNKEIQASPLFDMCSSRGKLK